VQPTNNDSKPGGERLWKSRSLEKSTNRTFPLRLEIRTHRGFPLYAQPRLLLENKKCKSTTKGDISIVRWHRSSWPLTWKASTSTIREPPS